MYDFRTGIIWRQTITEKCGTDFDHSVFWSVTQLCGSAQLNGWRTPFKTLSRNKLLCISWQLLTVLYNVNEFNEWDWNMHKVSSKPKWFTDSHILFQNKIKLIARLDCNSSHITKADAPSPRRSSCLAHICICSSFVCAHAASVYASVHFVQCNWSVTWTTFGNWSLGRVEVCGQQGHTFWLVQKRRCY